MSQGYWESTQTFCVYLIGEDNVGRLSDTEVVIERHVVEQGGVGSEHLFTEKTAPKQYRDGNILEI